jgi:hypothetical protein
MNLVAVQMRTTATAAQIWKLWTHVAGSPQWDTDVAWSRLHGDFATGTRGEFKLKRGPRLDFVIDSVSGQRGYTNIVRMPGLSVRFTHALDVISSTELRITHGAQLSGPLGWLLLPVARKPLRASLARALHNMVDLAERCGAAVPSGAETHPLSTSTYPSASGSGI